MIDEASLYMRRRKHSDGDGRQNVSSYIAQIGVRVREARKLAGLSQSQLAHAVGYSAANPISKIETGRIATVDVVMLDKIAEATNVPVPFLTGNLHEADERQNDMWKLLLTYQSQQIKLLEIVIEKLDRLGERLGNGVSRRRKDGAAPPPEG